MNPLKHHVPPPASGRKVLGCCDVYPGTTQCRAPLTTGGLGFRWRGGSQSSVASQRSAWTPEFGTLAFSMALSNASWQLCPRHDSFERVLLLTQDCHRSLMLMHVCALSGNAWTVGSPRKTYETGLFPVHDSAWAETVSIATYYKTHCGLVKVREHETLTSVLEKWLGFWSSPLNDVWTSCCSCMVSPTGSYKS